MLTKWARVDHVPANGLSARAGRIGVRAMHSDQRA